MRRRWWFLFGLMTAVATAPVAGSTRADFFWRPELAPSGPAVVVVSLDEQVIYVYRNGVAIGVGPISSGRPGHETPTGVYTILQKERVHRSNLYDAAPMPYMQRLTWDGIALHGGPLPGHPASHGCIRLPYAFAEKLYGITRAGGVVVVADRRVAPATVAHPAAVAPIDLAGRPVAFAGGAAALPPPGADGDGLPVSVVASLADRTVYVLRNGELLGSAPLDVSEPPQRLGTLLYVMDRPAPGGGVAGWSAYRILGQGPVPGAETLAGRLRMPGAFGQSLRALLRPGTTVLVTDLPGAGGQPHGFARLLQAESSAP